MSKRKQYSKSCQVSEIRTYTLNGYPQKVLFEGRSRTAPILLLLHGGPGSPLPFCAGCRGLFPEIEDRFITVYWDQLGCGMNDRVIDDSFSVDSYVHMTVELIRAIRKEFPENKLHLLGLSWGSVLAANAAARVPELIDRAVVYGQVIRELFFNREVFDALDGAKLNRKEKQEFERLKTVKDMEQNEIRAMAGLVRRHTEGYRAKNGGKTSMGKVLFGLLTSPDYTLKDCKAAVANGTMKNRSLWQELIRLDLRDTLAGVKIPYLILQGETDIVTSTKAVETFVRECGNENLHFCILPNSGHLPGGDGMNAMMEKGFAFLSEA